MSESEGVKVTLDKPQIKVRDFRGHVIEPGVTVAYAISTGATNDLRAGVVTALSTGLGGGARIAISGDAEGIWRYPQEVVVIPPADPVAENREDGLRKVDELHQPWVEPYAKNQNGAHMAGGWRARCSCTWRGAIKTSISGAQQDGINHLHKERAKVAGEEYTRASGSAICVVCSETYSDHPFESWTGSTGDLADSPLMLHRLCDGRLVKL